MIKNLPRQLNEAGKIKIGKKGNMITSKQGKEFRPPKKLDHFQLVTTEKNEDGDYIIDTALQNKLKESDAAIVNKDGCLVGLPIRLLYNDTELNFPNRYVSYVSGQLSCHGDGEKSFKRIDNFKKEHPCPCDRVTPGYGGQDKCKPTGTLTCIIDEAGLFGQAHKFRTTSMNTIKGILGGIELIKTATNGKIAGLPLMLTMNSKQTTTPQGIATTIYIVSICYRGSMMDLRTEVLDLLSTEKQYLLSMDSIEAAVKADTIGLVDEEEEKEFVEEFFPDAVVINSKVPETAKEIEEEKITAEEEKSEKPAEESAEESAEVKDNYDAIKDNETFKGIVEPVGAYKKIYDSFVIETDLDKAMSFAKRLQKGNLLYWLVNTYPDVDFDATILKPEALDLVENVLKSTLGTDTEPEQQEAAIKEDEDTNSSGEETKSNEYVSTWDDSGPIQKDQLRELVRLKLFLEGEGILRPDKWVDHVRYFSDADGKEIQTAKGLTATQGDTFITMLGNSVPVMA